MKITQVGSIRRMKTQFQKVICFHAILLELDALHILFATRPFRFRVTFCVVDTLRIDCKCTSVRQLLCAVLLIFINQKSYSFSDKYVLRDMHRV